MIGPVDQIAGGNDRNLIDTAVSVLFHHAVPVVLQRVIGHVQIDPVPEHQGIRIGPISMRDQRIAVRRNLTDCLIQWTCHCISSIYLKFSELYSVL
ncbi:hypothetical protein D3C74_357200 [compost metagenome]